MKDFLAIAFDVRSLGFLVFVIFILVPVIGGIFAIIIQRAYGLAQMAFKRDRRITFN